jgi:hypothetical protein
MRYVVWVLAFALGSTLAMAQDAEGPASNELGAFGIFSLGNLAVTDVQKAAEPLEQVKRFFSDVRMPLTSPQEKQLSAIVDTAVNKLRENGTDEAGVRRINGEYMKSLNGVLTADQRGELRRHRTEQIMLRGGFPALKLILEDANAPFSEDQEKNVHAVYDELNHQVDQMKRASSGPLDRAQVSRLQSEELGKVVRLLTPTQRRALFASRQGTLSARVRP